MIDKEIAELEREVEVVEGLARQAIQTNAREVIDQSEWAERNGKYLSRHAEATKQLEALDKLKSERLGKSKVLEVFIRDIKKQTTVITEWDESLWAATVESVTVGVDGKLTFKFKNGSEVTV
ncbi:MAG: hypothetical protein LBU32_21660 [Clostridiales bacterium]|jgi:hypothetical protein|nr:hypothetical protein [Clostridiales bacterium]